LPPVLTANILKEFLPLNKKKSPIVLDLMCGSGTTLVEAQRIGVRSIGVDSNNLSLLISKVKTTPLNIVMAETALKEFAKKFVSSNKKADTSKMAIKQQKFTLENIFRLSRISISGFLKNHSIT